MVIDTSIPDPSPHSSAMSPAECEAVERKKLALSKPPLLTHNKPPPDHAAYTHRLSHQFPGGSEMGVISKTPQYSGTPRTTLTPLSREEQLNYLPQSTTDPVVTPQIFTTVNDVTEEGATARDCLTISEVVCTSNPPSTSDSSLTLQPTTPSSSLDKTVQSTEDCVLNTVVEESDNVDKGSGSIRQAWIAAQALSQTTDSGSPQLTGDEKSEVSMDISSHDDEIIEEDAHTSAAGIVAQLT